MTSTTCPINKNRTLELLINDGFVRVNYIDDTVSFGYRYPSNDFASRFVHSAIGLWFSSSALCPNERLDKFQLFLEDYKNNFKVSK